MAGIDGRNTQLPSWWVAMNQRAGIDRAPDARVASALTEFEKALDETQSLRSVWGGRVSPNEAKRLIASASNAIEALVAAKNSNLKTEVATVFGELEIALPQTSMTGPNGFFGKASAADGFIGQTLRPGSETVSPNTGFKDALEAFERLKSRVGELVK